MNNKIDKKADRIDYIPVNSSDNLEDSESSEYNERPHLKRIIRY